MTDEILMILDYAAKNDILLDKYLNTIVEELNKKLENIKIEKSSELQHNIDTEIEKIINEEIKRLVWEFWYKWKFEFDRNKWIQYDVELKIRDVNTLFGNDFLEKVRQSRVVNYDDKDKLIGNHVPDTYPREAKYVLDKLNYAFDLVKQNK